MAYTFTTINPPGAFLTSAFGVNEAGQVAGNYYDGRFHGFLDTAGGFTTIDV
jgi:hypothetical protein